MWRTSKQQCLFLQALVLIQLLQIQVKCPLPEWRQQTFFNFQKEMLTVDATVTYIAICPFSSHICILCTYLSVHQVINRSLGSIIPRNVQKAVLEGLFSIGRAQVSDYILNEKNPLGSLRLARLRSILDEGKSLQLQFPAEDLGFWLVPLQLITSKESVVSFLSSVAGTTKQGRNILRPWRYANFLVMILFVCLQL